MPGTANSVSVAAVAPCTAQSIGTTREINGCSTGGLRRGISLGTYDSLLFTGSAETDRPGTIPFDQFVDSSATYLRITICRLENNEE